MSGDGRGGKTSGRFVIHELITDSSGAPLKLAADFKQVCEGFTGALIGSIRFNSTVSMEPRLAVAEIRLLEGDAGEPRSPSAPRRR